MPELAASTLTLLFTDIEGSTRLWEREPDAMRVGLAHHNSLLHRIIQDHGGHVFKTVGDSFCAAFATAPKALAASLDCQLSLLTESWPTSVPIQVRIGLHTGAAEMRDGDYVGPPLNRVARILAIGHGGQILVSAAVQELTQDTLAPSVSLKPLGSHRLKDLGRPEHVFQLCHPRLPSEFPPLRSLDSLPNNLPIQVTTFVGREKEIAEVHGLLGTSRLLTLTGSGGCGKTRLALQVAADLVDASSDGVWFVELAALADPALVPQTVASAMGLREEPGKSIMLTLIEYLKTKHLLLFVDNCEHLLSACADLCHSVIRACPQVILLCTSRQGLGVAGETTYRVPSLSLPDPGSDLSVTALSQYESVQLFVNRAVAAVTTFSVNNENAPALAAVCYRLGGIPLAIELAAARVAAMSIEDINTHLDQRFRLLTGGSRTALPRQQTLRSLIDWSYDLLTEPEKRLLARFSVFAGGWTLESCMTVCSGDGLEPWDVLDLLTSLVDKSLVAAEPAGQSVRYHLLETIRQYSRERLMVGGTNEQSSLCERHRDWFLALAEEAEPHLRGSDQVRWFGQLETEYDNLRAALAWCREEEGQAEAGLRLAGALRWLWDRRGHITEGLTQLAAALSQEGAGARTSIRAKALNGAGSLAAIQGDYASAYSHYENSLAIGRELGEKGRIATALGNMGTVALFRREYDAARPLIEEGLAIRQELGDRWGIGHSLCTLGNVAEFTGDYAGAYSHYDESLAIYRALGDPWGIANAYNNLGRAAEHRGDYASARSMQATSLRMWQEIGSCLGAAWSLEAFASLAFAEAQEDRAARLWGAAEALREAAGLPMEPCLRPEYDRRVGIVREDLGEDKFTAAWTEGRTMTIAQSAEFALERADA